MCTRAVFNNGIDDEEFFKALGFEKGAIKSAETAGEDIKVPCCVVLLIYWSWCLISDDGSRVVVSVAEPGHTRGDLKKHGWHDHLFPRFI
jgi:hypothetical protein